MAVKTNPNDDVSLGKAIAELNEMQWIYGIKGSFFENLRSRVSFHDRPQYITIISRLENLDIYAKLNELKECKSLWGGSSIALPSHYESLGVPIMQLMG